MLNYFKNNYFDHIFTGCAILKKIDENMINIIHQKEKKRK